MQDLCVCSRATPNPAPHFPCPGGPRNDSEEASLVVPGLGCEGQMGGGEDLSAVGAYREQVYTLTSIVAKPTSV